MSNQTSPTLSDDEDQTEVASSDGSDVEDAGNVYNGENTSEQLLTLKDEPSDLLVSRSAGIGVENDDDEDAEEELDEADEAPARPQPVDSSSQLNANPLNSQPANNGTVVKSSSIAATPANLGASDTNSVLPSSKSPVTQQKSSTPQEEQQQQQQQQPTEQQPEEKPVVAPPSATYDSLDTKKRVRRKKKNLWICLENCKYDVVHRMAKKYGFKPCEAEDDWNLYWTDLSVGLERVMDMKRYQKINHFPGMSELCRKDLLARNLNKMLKLFPKEYGFFPNTWVLPADYGELQAYGRTKKSQTYIIKPPASCQGRGIWLTKNPTKIKANEHAVVQTYLRKPFLIDGFKFDLRIYVTVTSCDPLRIFIFKDGLARFATCKYIDPTSNNCENTYMHLTNYAVQKNSDNYVDDEETGTKRRLTTINRWLRDNGYNVEKMWQDIDDVAIKTIISAQPVLRHNYRTCFPNHVQGSACFEVLGFDIVLDRKLRPYVLEVNHSPSFTTDAQIDLDIKEVLIYDTLDLINISGVDRKKCLEDDKRRVKERLLQKQSKKDLQEEMEREAETWQSEQEKYEAAHLGNYRRIYPIPGFTEKYDKYFQNSGSLFAETAAFRARQEAARQQREDLTRKQEQLATIMRKNKDRTLRPESPDRPSIAQKRRVIRRPPLSQKRLGQDDGGSLDSANGISRSNGGWLIDIMKPIAILDDEEIERLNGMIQRENLVRGLGVVEQVYRLLHDTAGTVGSTKPHPPNVIQAAALQNRITQSQFSRVAANNGNSNGAINGNGNGNGNGIGSDYGSLLNGSDAATVGTNKTLGKLTSDSGFVAGSRGTMDSRTTQRQTVAQLHIVSGPAELHTGNWPLLNDPNPAGIAPQWRMPPKMPNVEAVRMNHRKATYSANMRRASLTQAANILPAAVVASSAGTERSIPDLPLGEQMQKILAMQGSNESSLPSSLQPAARQNSLPLQSSDLIQYRPLGPGSSGVLQPRKHNGPGFGNTDLRRGKFFSVKALAKPAY